MNIIMLNSLHVLFLQLSALHSKTVFPMKLRGRQNLQSAESRYGLDLITLDSTDVWIDFSCFKVQYVILFFRHSTLLIELQGNDVKEMNYESGNNVGVFPRNPPELVMGILKHLTNAPPINQTI